MNGYLSVVIYLTWCYTYFDREKRTSHEFHIIRYVPVYFKTIVFYFPWTFNTKQELEYEAISYENKTQLPTTRELETSL